MSDFFFPASCASQKELTNIICDPIVSFKWQIIIKLITKYRKDFCKQLSETIKFEENVAKETQTWVNDYCIITDTQTEIFATF